MVSPQGKNSSGCDSHVHYVVAAQGMLLTLPVNASAGCIIMLCLMRRGKNEIPVSCLQ